MPLYMTRKAVENSLHQLLYLHPEYGYAVRPAATETWYRIDVWCSGGPSTKRYVLLDHLHTDGVKAINPTICRVIVNDLAKRKVKVK